MGTVVLSEIDWAGTSSPPTEDEFSRDAEFGTKVYHLHHYDRNGGLLNEPSVSFDDVVSATSRKIEITIVFSEREYTAVLPVLCHRGWKQNE